MSRFVRSFCAPAALLLACAVALFGCGGTRENRTITFSSNGDQVSFQHGRDGIYVADKDGTVLTKIPTPDKDAIAIGTPLWAPNDKRLIFTTARGAGNATAPAGDNPAGRVFSRQPAVCTCWLRDEPKGDAAPEVHKLFTADVDDVGYVAAGLAVRWHPKGDHILYVKQVGEGHAVFAFDLAGKTSRRVFPEDDTAKAVVFDWTPDGSHLVCVLADTPNAERQGIWIGRDDADWWHVAESSPLTAVPEQRLERLKAARPTWTKDGQRFAFVTALPGQKEGSPEQNTLWQGRLEGRQVARLLAAYAPIHDLMWHPDGGRLGFIRGREPGDLQIAQPDGSLATVTARPVRTFAGWDAKGEHLAYATPDDIPFKDENRYSLLFAADPLARDALWVAPGDGKEPGRAVISGLRATFAHWSPKEDKLSLWFTFSPTHHSLLSLGEGGGLRPGDPAAVIETKTGKIGWMAVDGNEKAQVGHYHLLKRDYAEAGRWYEQADRDLAPKPDAPKEAEAEPAGNRSFRDFSFFEYYCLTKLGRKEEAAAKLAAFRAAADKWLQALRPKQEAPAEGTKPANRSDEQALRVLGPVLGDCYAAEVFLSLDAAKDGEEFFRQALADAKTDDERYRAALVLSQLLLLEGKCAEYATLATDVLAPQMLKSWQPRPDLDAKLSERLMGEATGLGALGVLPLSRPDLLAKVPDERLPHLVTAWADIDSRAPDDLFALGSGLILEGVYKRAGRAKEAKEVRQRLEKLLVKADLPASLDGKAANEAMQQSIDAIRGLRQLLAGW